MMSEEILFEDVQQEDLPVDDVSAEEIADAEQPVEESAEDSDVVATEEVPADESAADAPADDTAVAEESEGETPSDEAAAAETPAVEEPAEEEAELSPLPEKAPYHERYYLRYRGGKRTTQLDLDGTKSFLQEIGFDGGELRQAREGKDRAASFRDADQGKGGQTRCSYCGADISGVEFYRLPDGRVRCTSCSNTLVETKAEVEELCKRVKDNLDNFFGAVIDVPVSIEVLEERKLKKKVGVPLGTQDSQSVLILGVAVNKKKKYRILLENGAPRISLIATFAHELTHIWQYTHWDNRKDFKTCPDNKRLIIYEGMAKWAEIQYLYLVGETTVARREEYLTRQRQDEYGIGFCLYEDRYPLSREAMICEDTPFNPNQYPFDDEE